MAKLHLTFTPKLGSKPVKNTPMVTHTQLAEAIRLRSMVIDWSKSGMAEAIIDEVKSAIKIEAVRSGIKSSELTGLPSKEYSGKHELYVYVGDDKATKIDLTIEPEPKLDIAKECPLFAKAKGAKANKEYLGGGEDEPHVHVYGGGFHLKLGNKRFNIVQKGVLYEEQLKDAHAALKSHALKDTLAPFVAAALDKFGML